MLPRAVRPQAVDADPARRRTYRLTREELEVLLSDEGTPDVRLVTYHLLALTGARASEVCGLRWRDVVPDEPLDRLVVAEQVRGGERIPTKTSAIKEVPVHPTLARELAGWRAGWEGYYGRAPTPDDLICPTRGRRLRGVGVARRAHVVWGELQRDLEGCGLPPHRVHDLRHTFVSLCADAGCAADVVARWTHAARGAQCGVGWTGGTVRDQAGTPPDAARRGCQKIDRGRENRR